MSNTANSKINGLAQGGGGLWGIAHVGVLRWMQEHKVPIHAISGVSMGAIVGAIAASYIDDGLMTREGIAYLEQICGKMKCMNDLIEKNRGTTVIAIERLLEDANQTEFRFMMHNGLQVPFSAQVRRHANAETEEPAAKEVFLEAKPGADMKDVLQMVRASSANGKMFGIDPVIFQKEMYSDDLSTSYRSVSACVRTLRTEMEGIRVIGTSISFRDSVAPLRWATEKLFPSSADTGDVRIRPKEGHQIQNRSHSITNWKKGWGFPGLGDKYAKSMEDIYSGKRIEIPVKDFVQAGYEAAKKNAVELLKLRVM